MATTKAITKNAAYTALQEQAKKKGLQKEEKAVIAKVMANRGRTQKEARLRVKDRLAKGLGVGGKGGKGGTKVGLRTTTTTTDDGSEPTTKTSQVNRKTYRASKKPRA